MSIGNGGSELDFESDNDFEVETGPFCRHFFDPTTCEIRCARCDVLCPEHDVHPREYLNSQGNLVYACEEWQDPKEKPDEPG